MSQFPWESAFCEAITRGDAQAALLPLQAAATGHAGTANAKTKRRALQLTRSCPGDRLFELALTWADSPDPTANELAAILLAERFAQDPDQVSRALRELAGRDHWEVREWAASGCGLALQQHFAAFYPALQGWAKAPDANLRRAVALAAMYGSRGLPESRADPLLDLVEPLLPDREPYVRKNLGPFALGDGLLPRYPRHTLARLEHWAGSPDEMVCWNVAMVFTAAAARKYAADGLRILTKLEPDPRPTVKRAVQSAMRRLLAS